MFGEKLFEIHTGVLLELIEERIAIEELLFSVLDLFSW